MLFKLVVLACVASTLADEYGRWVSTSPHRNDPIPPGISPPARFPAGVDPHSCPNYPHCGNPNTAIGANGAPGGWNSGANNGAWNGGQQGGWNGGQQQGGWNGGQQGGWNGGNNAGHNPAITGSYTGDGDYHGEGLQEAGAYGDISHNTEIWNNGINDGGQNGGWNGGNNGGWNGGNNGAWNNGGHNNNAGWNPQAQPASLPAGVHAGQCPNYPYCH